MNSLSGQWSRKTTSMPKSKIIKIGNVKIEIKRTIYELYIYLQSTNLSQLVPLVKQLGPQRMNQDDVW